MRNLLLLCIAVFSFGFAHAQDCTGADHTVLAGNLYYNPASLTITAGETIAFQNEGGTHNVNGVSSTLGDTWNNPETFSLGANSGAPGGVCMGTVTLNTPGTYQYDCSIGSHAAGGMVGTIIVEAAAPSTVDVTINVNMANETTSPDGVFLAGGLDFGVAGDNPMSDTDGDDIWTITVQVPVGYTGNYTFLNGNCPDWSCKENIGGQSCADGPYSDRLLSNITENTTINTCFSECTTDGSCTPIGVQPAVTFQVDMSNANLAGGEAILVTGSFDGWCGGCSPALTDTDGDNIYTGVLNLNPNADYEFKYMINGWGGDEQSLLGTDCDFLPGDGFGNRGFSLGESDLVLDVQCFDFCGTCAEQDAAGPTDPVGPTDNAAEPTLAQSEVISVYGSAYTSIATNLNPGWGQSGTVNAEYDPGTGNTVLQYANFNYQGTDLTNADASGMTHLHLDVWVEAGTDRQLKVTPVNAAPGGNQESLVNVPLTPGAWNSVDLAQTDFVGMTWENLIQMKFDGQFNGDGSANPAGWDVYLDNIYFWNDGSGTNGGGGGTAGCMDADASNYNDLADTDDGSCTYDITFQVDMSQAGLVDGDIAYVNGSFNGWCGACNPLSDDDADGVWTATIPLAPGVIEYKFTINGWTAQEELGVGAACDYNPADEFANRGVEIVDAPITLDVVCYNSCEACVIGGDVNGCTDELAANYNSAATIDDGSCTYPVTFKVDMSDYTGTYGVVNLNGSFNGWCGGCNAMTDTGDNVYEVTINVPADTIEYKFTLDGWTAQEEFAGGEECTSTIDGFTNRSSIITGATVLDVVCYNSCTTCDNAGTGGGGGSTDLVATLDVSCSGMTDITEVRLFGPFWNWDPAGGPVATLNADGNYEVVFSPAPDADMEYKWLINGEQEDLLDFGPDLNGDGYDDFLNADCVPITDYFSYANRQWTVGSGDIADTWSQCAPCPAADSVLVTITVDMSEEEVNPIGVFVAGTFQGWSPGSTIATDNGDGTWSYSFNAMPGDNVEYKWLNGTAWGFEESVPADCQYPGDTNRGFDVPNEDYSHPVHCFGSCNACGAATYAATFTVLTDNITVAADGMHIAGAFEGWSGTTMSDNGDGSWSITLDLEAGGYEFKFQNGLGGWEELDCGGNRSVTIDGSGAVSYTGCFAQCGESTACATDPDPANITFRVDMSEVTDLVADSVYMIGGFTDPVWQAGAILMDDTDGDLVYEATVLVSGPASIAYKFFNGNPYPNGQGTEVGGETADFAAGGCGVDNGVGGFNRTHDRSGAEEVLDIVCFNSCAACGDAPLEGTEVTFSVDMNNYGAAFGFVNVSGTWNEFCGDCNPMTDDDMDGIWTATVTLPEGENYRYKFQVDNWADQEDLAPGDDPIGPCVVKEGGFTNRDLDVAGSEAIVLDTVCWNSCEACIGADDVAGCNDETASNYDAAATANDGSCIYDVTFSVNMNEYALADGDTVYVNSEFNGWCGACNPMSDDDMDGVWTVTLPLASDYYEYKFTVNGWAADENLAGIGGCVTENFGFTNRVLQLFGNQSEPVVCWNSCSNCEGGGDIAGCTDPNAVNYAAIATVDDGSCQYNVTFQVDMSTTALNGGDIVYVNGGFNGWCGACNPMSDDDMDGVWTVTLPLPGGEHEYKFTINGWDMQEELTVGDICDWNPNDTFANRGFNLTGDLVLDVVCYNSCYSCDVSTGCTDAGAQNYDADADVDDGSCAYMVTLRLDMSQQMVSADGVHVAGSFQGWDPAGTSMTTPGLDLYEYTLQLSNGAHQFIYINGNTWDGQETVPAECGADNGLGGYNREIIVDGADMVLPVVCLNSCTACSGCTDPLSMEFSPFAGEDDGSCATPLVFGCTYQDADNFNPAANMEDGSCEFTGGSSCPTDIDGDGSTAVGDLLIILGSFGQPCE